MDFYYYGAWRMDWALGNPNKTATLIACLMLATWTLAYQERRWGYWLALPLFTALGCCLVETYSRGGMLAFLAGGAVLLAGTRQPWRKSRVIGITLSVCVIGVFILLSRAGNRYGQGLLKDDQSIASRLVIWRHFPEMLAAAPWGVGWGHAGEFYTQWFQPPGESINYLNLINSHFTWMVEGGWAFSMLYLFGWCTIVLVCWPGKEAPLGTLPLAVWMAFGVGAVFSHVEDTIWLWICPLGFLGYALGERWRLDRMPVFRPVAHAALGSFAAVILLIAMGRVSTPWPIIATRNAVSLGHGTNATIIYIDRDVMGQLYGHTLRSFLASNRETSRDRVYMVTESIAMAIPPGADEVVVAGKSVREVAIATHGLSRGRVIIINPECFPVEARWYEALASRSSLYWGEYADSPARAAWPETARAPARVVAGAGDFIPRWPQVIWKAAGS